MRRPLSWLINAEIPEINERYRPLITVTMLAFTVGFALMVVLPAVFHEEITLGPGLTDEAESPLALAQRWLLPFADSGTTTGWVFLYLFLPLLAGIVVWNAFVTYRGYSTFRQAFGRPYPMQHFVTFLGTNAALVFVMWLVLAGLGLGCWIGGVGFDAGWNAIRHITVYAKEIIDRIPTLVVLPYPLPLVAALLSIDFFFYWFHRWGHTTRIGWLLYHRPHHLPTHLIIPTTQPVFAPVPLFLLISLPYQVALGALAKVFHPEVMIMEALVFRAIGQAAAIYAHSSAYYDRVARSPVLMFLGALYGGGNHHYLHHSSKPEHLLINVSGMLFYVWDHIFGTYEKPPKEKPPIGLTGDPPLYMNPLRLALAGMMQMAYEVRHNRSWRARLLIVFGSSGYVPPVTRDYAIHEEPEVAGLSPAASPASAPPPDAEP